MPKPSETLAHGAPLPCEHCQKSTAICVCDLIAPGSLSPKTRVLVLQHPQEPDKELGSARIAHLALKGSVLKTGLSWRNLSAALGEEVSSQRWGVLYLGTQKSSAGVAKPESKEGGEPCAQPTDKEVLVLNPRGEARGTTELDGIVVLDGNWRQAKALWWRNAWLLKLNRIVLAPKQVSLYGALRREPRLESVSTLEAIALTLGVLEPTMNIRDALLSSFKTFLERCRTTGMRGTQPAPKKDWRRRRGFPRQSR